MARSIGNEPRLLDLKTVIGELGGPQRVSRELMVTAASVYRWIAEGSLPRDRVTAIAEVWELPRWLLHDPWSGTPWAMKHMTADETREFMEHGAAETTGNRPLAKGEKPKPPPMLTEEGQPTPGWKYTYRPPKVDQYNPLIVVKVRPGARWIEDFPEGKVGFPERLTWLDGREIRMVDNGTGTPVYVEADTGMHFGGSKVHLKMAHAAFRAMAERGIHERVEVKWEGVDGED